MNDFLRACGGYWFEGHYIVYEIRAYWWAHDDWLYVRASWINGQWFGKTTSHNLDELRPQP